TSGRTRTMVAYATPVVGSNVVGYQITPETVRSGVVLQVTPHLEAESQESHVTLDLQSNVTEVGDNAGKIGLPDSFHSDPTTQQSTPSIDRINEINQELHTTVRLPLQKKVLIGGMTLEPASKEDPTSQLYLVIEADAVK
ncbi:MAG TPA: hypothetical protein VHS31_05875, partial [Tepidisphaeraceae bacterium]|nr:hypothetical protein [Tepidisphaeraceae bacterium]